MLINDTIVAISTALAESAISVIRLSGNESIAMVDALFNQSLNQIPSHKAVLGLIIDPTNHEIVDEVFVTVFKAPRSFTTEDIVEISCHGGVIVTQRILALCIAQKARLANPGEFTQRAYWHGRIDLAQAEAIIDLIQAPSSQSATLAIAGIRGSVAALIQPLMDELLTIIAQIEVNIDYPEYDDIEQLTHQKIAPLTISWLEKLDRILELSESGRFVKEGVKTVILGKPNVGKSSILNALLEEEKAIVTDIAGTTRDLVEGWIRLKNVTLHLMDTAGWRETSDQIEKIGIDKTKKALEEADLVILVIDASTVEDEEDLLLLQLTQDKQRIIVFNKRDIAIRDNELSISALNQDIQPLIQVIEDKFAHHQIAIKEPTLSNQRQIGLAMQARQAVHAALMAIEQDFEVDIVTIDLQLAYQALGQILNLSEQPKLLDTIFSRFCLGK